VLVVVVVLIKINRAPLVRSWQVTTCLFRVQHFNLTTIGSLISRRLVFVYSKHEVIDEVPAQRSEMYAVVGPLLQVEFVRVCLVRLGSRAGRKGASVAHEWLRFGT
jgi:hypothetical protein